MNLDRMREKDLKVRAELNDTDVVRRRLLISGAGAVAGVAALGVGSAFGQQAPTGQQPAGSNQQTSANQMTPGSPNSESILTGKVAVVTGAARGIGRSIAVEYAANGADVVGIDIAGPVSTITKYPHSTPADLAETGHLVQSHGRRFLPVIADIRDISALRSAAEQAEQQMGHIDIVVADAGIQAFMPLLEMDDRDWHDIIDVNLNGTANTIRAFGPHLVKRGGGRIIVLASMQGRYGTKNGASYSASKWGIIGLMKSAALELGKHKITVNAVVPGLIDTPMTRNEKRWSEAIGETVLNPPKDPTEQQTVAARLPHSPLRGCMKSGLRY